MAGTPVQAAYNSDDSGTSATTIAVTLNNVVQGNLIAVHVGWGDAPSTITCTVNDGSAYSTAAAKVRQVDDTESSQVFYLGDVAAGTHTITATFSTTTDFRRIRAYEISGLLKSGALDRSAGQQETLPGTGANAVDSTATAITREEKEMVVGFSQDTSETDPGSGTITAGTGYTIFGSNIILAMEYKNVTSKATQIATFTQSVNNNRVTHVVTFVETVYVVYPRTRIQEIFDEKPKAFKTMMSTAGWW